MFSSATYSGGNGLLSIWYSSPPFRVNHCAKRTIELEWENENDSSGSKLLILFITYQKDGSYLIEVLLFLVIYIEDSSY